MADLVLVEELAQYLIDQGICRAWGSPPGTTRLPQVIKDPRDGAPQPGVPDTAYEPEPAIVTLVRTGEIPPRWLEEYDETQLVQVIVRARNSRTSELLQRQIKRALVNRRNFLMGALRVQWAQQFAGVSPLAADDLSYDTTQTFAVCARTKSLAGLPYAT